MMRANLYKFLRGLSNGLIGHKQPVRPGKVSNIRSIIPSIRKPPYASREPSAVDSSPVLEIKDQHQIVKMKNSCKVARHIFDQVKLHIKPGISTDELDAIFHEECIRKGVYPSTLLYKTFPKSICTSVNNVVCHGIPDDRILENGDIISVDFTAYVDGFHGDLCETILVGECDAVMQRLVEASRLCRDAGIAVCGPGVLFSQIGTAIENEVNNHGFHIVPGVCGHFIGASFHAEPNILHIPNDYHFSMEPGMTFTVEPIISEKVCGIKTLEDGWTVVTSDDSWTAQFEHTILITPDGVEILTV